jgi:large subunit ribosomal protein L7Ae
VQVVHKKTATALAITSLKAEDTNALQKLTGAIRSDFNDRHEEVCFKFSFECVFYLILSPPRMLTVVICYQLRRRWGGGIMGGKTQAALARLEKAKAKEIQAKA